MLTAGVVMALSGCAATGKPSNAALAAREKQTPDRPVVTIEVPRRIGTVENVGLQVPVISPDGEQMLYLRTDQDRLAPMTVLGSSDPADTPPEGTLAIWVRLTSGAAPGHRLSEERWAHSPVWSDTGRAVVYVVNEASGSYLVHTDLTGGKRTVLGMPDAINCMPRFDGDDRAVIFCAGPAASGPMRVYRQGLDGTPPVPLSPEGTDCVCPVMTNRGEVLCAQVGGDHLNWAWCRADATKTTGGRWGLSGKLEVLQVWAGIATAVSPDRRAVMFYDVAQDRVSVLQVSERVVRQHRPRSIAACWLDSRTIALATPDGAFVTDASTGVSTSLSGGQWIPCRYAPSTNKLILLGQQGPTRFAIWEVVTRLTGNEPRTSRQGSMPIDLACRPLRERLDSGWVLLERPTHTYLPALARHAGPGTIPLTGGYGDTGILLYPRHPLW